MWRITLAGMALAAMLGACVGKAQPCINAVKRINEYRALHGAPGLSWSDASLPSTKSRAEAYAALFGCDRPDEGTFILGPQTGLDMNEALVYQCNGDILQCDCNSAVDFWYSTGAKLYKFTGMPWTDNKHQWAQVAPFVKLIWAANVSTVTCVRQPSSQHSCSATVCRFAMQMGPALRIDPGRRSFDEEFLGNVQPRLDGVNPADPPGSTNMPVDSTPAFDPLNVPDDAFPDSCPRWVFGGGELLSCANNGRLRQLCPKSCAQQAAQAVFSSEAA